MRVASPDLLAQRWLLDAEFGRSPGHLPALRNRNEVPQVTQVHMQNVSTTGTYYI
jgi:hypothetical protein